MGPGHRVSRVLQGAGCRGACVFVSLVLPLEPILSQSVLGGHGVEGLPFGVSVPSCRGGTPHKNEQRKTPLEAVVCTSGCTERFVNEVSPASAGA